MSVNEKSIKEKINKPNIDPKEVVDELKREETKFKNYLGKLIKEEEILLKASEELQKKYDKKMKQIEKKMKMNTTNSFLSSSYIMEKCERVIGYFLQDNAVTKLQFKIDGIKDVLTIPANSKKTFYDLKKEIKNNFAKNEDDFFLSDENGLIYLDDLIIKNCLFPLKNCSIRNYIPTIYVVEQHDSNNQMIKLNVKKQEVEIKDEEEAIRKMKAPTMGNFLFIFRLIYLATYISLVILWIFHANNFKRIHQYKAIENFLLSKEEGEKKEIISVNEYYLSNRKVLTKI